MSFQVFAVSSRSALYGVPILLTHTIPPLICFIAVAVLAVKPQTRAVRAALWPVLALLAFRAAASVNIADPLLNACFVVVMIAVTVRSLGWGLEKGPLVRHLRPANSAPSTMMDVLDLVSNCRGHGWNWSRGLYVPRETRPTHRIAFALYALFSGIAGVLISGVFHQAIKTFTAGRDTIFDETLAFPVRYLRAGVISALVGFTAHIGMQMNYDMFTVFGVLVFGQDPAQWPPAFDNPWRATSLCDFWGRRWHQFFRQVWLLGAYPFSLVFGRAGQIMGAFLASALCHHVIMMAFGGRSDMWSIYIGFGMMGPGVLAERAYYKLTGSKVDGVVGWVWTMAWLFLWGSRISEGFIRGGMFESKSAIHDLLPVRTLIDNWVMDVDGWLHTMT